MSPQYSDVMRADPQEMRKFAADLDVCLAEVMKQKKLTDDAIRDSRENWQDDRYKKLVLKMNDAGAELDRFASAAKAYAGWLREQAKTLDDYLAGR